MHVQEIIESHVNNKTRKEIGQRVAWHRWLNKPFEFFLAVDTELDSLTEFGEDDQIKDEWTGQQRILARVVNNDRVVAAHQNLARVLVHRTLAVSHVRHILDDDAMVRVLARSVQQLVRLHHVIHHVALRNLQRQFTSVSSHRSTDEKRTADL